VKLGDYATIYCGEVAVTLNYHRPFAGSAPPRQHGLPLPSGRCSTDFQCLGVPDLLAMWGSGLPTCFSFSAIESPSRSRMPFSESHGDCREALLDWEIHRASLNHLGRPSLLKVLQFPHHTTGSRPSDGIRMIASLVLPCPQAYRGRIAGKKITMVARLWLPLLQRAMLCSRSPSNCLVRTQPGFEHPATKLTLVVRATSKYRAVHGAGIQG
jgi:hypothetical protein